MQGVRWMLTSLALASASLPALAADLSCHAQAAEKKLAGAAKTAFLKKCETDATAKCEAAAVEKKLAGAAKTAFLKKCEAEAIGSGG